MKTRYWVGHRRGKLLGQVFKSEYQPNERVLGTSYFAVTGPFSGKLAAMIFAEGSVGSNPNMQAAYQANAIARKGRAYARSIGFHV